MARPNVTVRRVDPDLRPRFADLWIAQRVDGGVCCEDAREVVRSGRLDQCMDRAGLTAYLASVGHEDVGYAVVTDSASSLFTDAPAVTVEQLFVREGYRRHGVARSLLTAVASYADRCGAETISTCVPSHGREINRFFARLGFTPQLVRRTTSTTALLRRLAGSESANSLEAVLARRRAKVRAARTTLAS